MCIKVRYFLSFRKFDVQLNFLYILFYFFPEKHVPSDLSVLKNIAIFILKL